MTIKGVKQILENKDFLKLDETKNNSINPTEFKNKLVEFSNLLKKLKRIK